MAEINNVTVNSEIDSWQSEIALDPDTTWIILPSSASSWTINGGANQETFQGSDWMDGEELNIPGKLRVGGLAVLVWLHREDDDPIPQILTFPPGVAYRSVSIGPSGGSMHFIIADKADTYGDNQGLCEVEIIQTDRPHLELMNTLNNSYMLLDSDGFAKAMLKCGLTVASGALAGSTKGGGASGAVIWGGAAAIGSADCDRVVHEVVVATQELISDGNADEGADGHGHDIEVIETGIDIDDADEQIERTA